MKSFKWKSENFFIIILFVFVTLVIFLLLNFKGTVSNDIAISSKNVTTDAITSVMSATDNAMNKIYNIIVITTVYITVIITTFSLFQYIKSKEIENIKKDLQDDILELKRNVEKDRTSLDNEVEKKVFEMNLVLAKIKKEALDTSNSNRIDLLEMKAESEKSKNTKWNDDNALKSYKEILNILDLNPGLIEKQRESEIYHYYAMLLSNEMENIEEAEKYYYKSIDCSDPNGTFQAYSYSNLGLIKLNTKFYSKAIELFEKSIRINETNIRTQQYLIQAFDRRNDEGDIDRAFSLLKNLRGIRTNDEADTFFNIVEKVKIENVSKKYQAQIDELKQKYVHDFPELLSSDIN